MRGKCKSFCVCVCVNVCVHVCWFLELKKTWLMDHSRNFIQGTWDSVLRASHVTWDADSRHLYSWAPRGLWPLSHPLIENLHTKLLQVYLSWLRATGRLVGSVTESGHAGIISNHFSISICRDHHSFWPHIRPSNRAPHWKTTTGRPRTYWTRPCHTSSGATGVRGQSIWWPFWPAGHHTTLVWVQGTNPPLKWLVSFFPNLNSLPTKSEI